MRLRATITIEYEPEPAEIEAFGNPSPEEMAALDQEAFTAHDVIDFGEIVDFRVEAA